MTPLLIGSVLGPVGPTGFAVVVWGAILLVVLAFIYIVWALLTDHHTTT